MSLKNGNTDTLYTIKLFRFNPDTDREPRYDTFCKQFPYGTTVLEALLNIQETEDDSLAFRYSCRSAVCGSCGMLVNGAPVLACRTQLASLIGDSGSGGAAAQHGNHQGPGGEYDALLGCLPQG